MILCTGACSTEGAASIRGVSFITGAASITSATSFGEVSPILSFVSDHTCWGKKLFM